MRSLTQELARTLGRALQPVHIRGIPRLLYVSAPWLLGSGRQVVRSVSGAIIDIDSKDYAGCMMFYGRYAPEIIDVIHAAVRPGDSVIDVGAQLGYITYQLAEAVGSQGKVHSFEPDPHALARLRALVQTNRLGRVEVFPFAASNREGELAFYLSATLGWSTAVRGSHLTDLSSTTVRSVRIDELWLNGSIQRPVRFVKLDIEGHECEALEGMQLLLERDRPIVVAEVNPPMLRAAGRSGKELLQRLAAGGFRLHRLTLKPATFRQGSANLEPVDLSAEPPICDVVALPEEQPNPNLLR